MSLSFKKLGNYGRLGNALFQYAAMIGFGEKYNQKIFLPHWKHRGVFEESFPAGSEYFVHDMEINESVFHYNPDFLSDKDLSKNIDICGYFQSEKYFLGCAEKIKKALMFKKSFVKEVMARVPAHIFSKETIAIHIRRGDYVGNSNYVNLPITYYISALENHFPDWKNKTLMIFSDDINYARVHFGCLENAYFSQGNLDIEDLCLMSQCDHFIIANSSYSWWGAWLGEKEGTKVVRPARHFSGALAERSNIIDLYPERWIEHLEEKIDLTDVAFTIPVFHDHLDRKKNLDLSVCMLQHYFHTSIIIGEQGMNKFEYMSKWCAYIHFAEMNDFHRTKMLNIMALKAQSAGAKIIANWDCDVVIAPMQILETVKKIRNGADMVYPYEWMFARIPRQEWFQKLEQSMDIGIVGNTQFMGMREGDATSFGGAVFFNAESFIKGGMENEKFISFGPEDSERRDRFTTLGFNVQRTRGPLYHINHWVGPNSSKNHPHFAANREEYKKVAAMKKYMLEDYIKTWKWIPKLSDGTDSNPPTVLEEK